MAGSLCYVVWIYGQLAYHTYMFLRDSMHAHYCKQAWDVGCAYRTDAIHERRDRACPNKQAVSV